MVFMYYIIWFMWYLILLNYFDSEEIVIVRDISESCDFFR